MLRDDLQTALNDVVVACLEAADGYEAAAGLLDEAALAARFRELADRRRAAAEELAQDLRALGDLPRTPDSDFEAVEIAVSHLKAWLAEDPERSVLDERLAAEVRIADAVAEALAQPDLPEDARQRLEHLRDEVAAAQGQLGAAAHGSP
jgi:uncharacterized protein (TIGR02284 family)